MPVPDEFRALCNQARKIQALKATGFARRLFDSWNNADAGRVQNWWNDERVPRGVWRDALNEVAGQPAERQNVAFFIGVVRNPSNWARHAKLEAEAKKPEREYKIFTAEGYFAELDAIGVSA